MTNFHVDWFQVTEPTHSDFSEFLRHQFAAWDMSRVHGKGFSGYEHRNVYAGSVVEMWSDNDDRMGVNWRFSGGSFEAVQAATSHEPNWRYWVRQWAKRGQGNITRIDLASDFHQTDVRDVITDIMHGMNEGLIRKRSWRTIENDALGYTGYFGSRHSGVMLRAYDKGAELNLEPFKLARTEFEVKREKSHAIGDGLRGLSLRSISEEDNIGYWLEQVLFGLMLDFIPVHTLSRLGVDKWGVQPITLGSWLPKVSNEDAWWWNVVVPAFEKRARLDTGYLDMPFVGAFIDEIRRRLKIPDDAEGMNGIIG